MCVCDNLSDVQVLQKAVKRLYEGMLLHDHTVAAGLSLVHGDNTDDVLRLIFHSGISAVLGSVACRYKCVIILKTLCLHRYQRSDI